MSTTPTTATGRELALLGVDDELAKTVTHGVGLLLAAGGALEMFRLRIQGFLSEHALACAVFGTTLLLMYAASTLYHAARDARQ